MKILKQQKMKTTKGSNANKLLMFLILLSCLSLILLHFKTPSFRFSHKNFGEMFEGNFKCEIPSKIPAASDFEKEFFNQYQYILSIESWVNVEANTLKKVFERIQANSTFLLKYASVIHSNPNAKKEFVFVTTYCGSKLVQLRSFIGSIHRNFPHSNIIVYGHSLQQDMIDEINLFINTKFLQFSEFTLSLLTPEKKSGHGVDDKVFNMNADKVYDMCSLSYKYEPPPISYPKNKKPRICMCILGWVGNKKISVEEYSLVSIVIPSMMKTIQEQEKQRFQFELFLGTQVDPFFDDPENTKRLLQIIEQNAKAHHMEFPVTISRFPLNKGLIDITFKWDELIKEAYIDGCDYFYQYSDDTLFLTEGWASSFVDCLENQNGFGIAGMTDTNNPVGTVTLSFSGRKHINIFGFYWPTSFKNWYSDDWAQLVYKNYFCHPKDQKMRNKQSYGRRYAACNYNSLEIELQIGRKKIYNYLISHPNEFPKIDASIFKE